MNDYNYKYYKLKLAFTQSQTHTITCLHAQYTHTYAATDDYAAVPQNATIPVVFATGRLSTQVFIHIINDKNIESDESFFGRLKINDLQVVTITQDTAEITIRDDDCKL